MKVLHAVLLSAVLAGCQKGSDSQGERAKLESERDKVSYSIGVNIGMNMLRDSVDFNPAPLLQGLKDAALDTSKRLMTPSEMNVTIMAYQQELQGRKMENAKKQGETNLKEGNEFLTENKKKEGVVTLPSGLQYKVIKEGTGPKPGKDQYVTAHYKGTFVNGKEFDSSYGRGEPATFRVTGVIAGWTEALQLMKVGSKWELYIPANLAYGEQGAGPIGPNQTLIFEVELLGIKSDEKAK